MSNAFLTRLANRALLQYLRHWDKDSIEEVFPDLARFVAFHEPDYLMSCPNSYRSRMRAMYARINDYLLVNDPQLLRETLLEVCRHYLQSREEPWTERFERNDVIYDLDICQLIGFGLFFYEDFEGHVLRCILSLTRADDTVVEIGANVGAYAAPIARHLTSGHLHAFEPNPSVFATLSRTVAANKLQARTSLYNFALGETHGVLPLTIPRSNDGAASLVAGYGPSEEVEVIDIPVRRWVDEWEQMGCPEIRLVKIDVEGFELTLVESMQEFLSSVRPYIVLEVSPSLLDAPRLISLVESLGYTCQVINTDDSLTDIDLSTDLQFDALCSPTSA